MRPQWVIDNPLLQPKTATRKSPTGTPLDMRLARMAVPSGDCLVWRGGTNGKGYGSMIVSGKRVYAHRIAWTLARGPIPDGMQVLHRCDNRPCINVEHLFLGTALDNQRDAVAKGRNQHGERHAHARLTAADVVAIRASALSMGALAARYGVSKGAIQKIIERRNWRHVP